MPTSCRNVRAVFFFFTSFYGYFFSVCFFQPMSWCVAWRYTCPFFLVAWRYTCHWEFDRTNWFLLYYFNQAPSCCVAARLIFTWFCRNKFPGFSAPTWTKSCSRYLLSNPLWQLCQGSNVYCFYVCVFVFSSLNRVICVHCPSWRACWPTFAKRMSWWRPCLCWIPSRWIIFYFFVLLFLLSCHVLTTWNVLWFFRVFSMVAFFWV